MTIQPKMSIKNMKYRAWAVSIGVATLLVAGQSPGVGTRRFVLDTGADFKNGDLKGVAVDSTGRLRPGFDLGEVRVTDASVIWSALQRKDGSVLLGTGNEGKLLSVKGAKVSLLAETKALVITSLVEGFGGDVFMGTLPEGKVLKLSGGKVTDFVKLEGTEHIWQLAYDAASRSLYAATGPEGKLWRIDANGRAQVHFDAQEKHLMSVAVGKGVVYAGASDKAKLYAIKAPGRASVLYDFGRTEVRGIQVGPKGEVYAIANQVSGSGVTSTIGRRRSASTAGPAAKPSPTGGKGTLYRFSPDGRPEQLLDDTSEHFVSLSLGRDGKPYVGTGVQGRVYTVDDAHNEILVADVDARQVNVLLFGGQKRFLGASDPAVLHPVRGVGGADSTWTSKVLDSGLRARFGRLSWDATGPIEISTRTGNTEEPDTTWSAWSAGTTTPKDVGSPRGRFIQVRARWRQGKASELSRLTIPFVTDNLRAVITSIDTGSSNSSSKSTASGGPVSSKAEASVSLNWKVDNPDSDELRYRLEYRLVGAKTWYDLLPPGEKLTSTSHKWKTEDLPEGRYRVRVTVSDEHSNPPEQVTRHQLESGIVIVDNSPPRIEGLKLTGTRLTANVVDGVGPIQRIEVSRAGSDEWFPFHPKDGIFDEAKEELDADIKSLLGQGPAVLAVRVYDEGNNFVVRNVAAR